MLPAALPPPGHPMELRGTRHPLYHSRPTPKSPASSFVRKQVAPVRPAGLVIPAKAGIQRGGVGIVALWLVHSCCTARRSAILILKCGLRKATVIPAKAGIPWVWVARMVRRQRI